MQKTAYDVRIGDWKSDGALPILVSLSRNWRIDCRRGHRQFATPPRLGPYLLKAVDGTGQGRSSAVNWNWTYSAKLVRQARRTSKGKAKTKSGAAYLGPRCRHCHLRTLRQTAVQRRGLLSL